ncbi:hypothetical protein PWEIH_08221 [Listeria weihenstephanensis FSL R9-0317]|nr:hypothetical protein PWEIH_08221 [Listeria weihenstephanensis FSL R9-0317]
MKKILNETFSLFSMILLVLIIWTTFNQNGDIFYTGRFYILALFVVIVLGRYILTKTGRLMSLTPKANLLTRVIEEEGFIVFGIFFLVLTVVSCFTNDASLIYKNRLLLIIFLLVNTTGIYMSGRKKI